MAVSGRPGQRTVHVVNGRDGDFAGTGKYVLLNAPNFRILRPALHDLVANDCSIDPG